MRRALLPLLPVLAPLAVGCARANARPPLRGSAEALAAVLADTAAPGGRVYRAGDVAVPVVTDLRTRMPYWGEEDGCAVLQFVVDTSGRVEPGTVVVAPHSLRALADATDDALRTWWFLPAERPAGRRVRQLAEFTVVQRGNATGVALASDSIALACRRPDP